jgi:anti-sigma factor RsiW
MSSLLQQLENNEQVLLMYLAGELPAQDRAEVQRMLGNDAGLRAMLEELSDLDGQLQGDLAGLAGRTGPAAGEASIRRTIRQMRRRQVEQALRPQADEQPAATRRYPWWMYSAGAAAAAVVILVGLWGVGVIDVLDTHRPSVVLDDSTVQDVVLAELQRSLGGGLHAWQIEDEVERHLVALQVEDDVLALFGGL